MRTFALISVCQCRVDRFRANIRHNRLRGVTLKHRQPYDHAFMGAHHTDFGHRPWQARPGHAAADSEGMLNAFQGRIDPPRVTVGYQGSQLVVCGAMLLLPLLWPCRL